MGMQRSRTASQWGSGRLTAAERAQWSREQTVRAELAALSGGAVAGEWAARGACAGRGDDLMFPIGVRGSRVYDRQVAVAKRVCGACPVRAECLVHALDAGESVGVWGGLDAVERSALRRDDDDGDDGREAA